MDIDRIDYPGSSYFAFPSKLQPLSLEQHLGQWRQRRAEPRIDLGKVAFAFFAKKGEDENIGTGTQEEVIG